MSSPSWGILNVEMRVWMMFMTFWVSGSIQEEGMELQIMDSQTALLLIETMFHPGHEIARSSHLTVN